MKFWDLWMEFFMRVLFFFCDSLRGWGILGFVGDFWNFFWIFRGFFYFRFWASGILQIFIMLSLNYNILGSTENHANPFVSALDHQYLPPIQQMDGGTLHIPQGFSHAYQWKHMMTNQNSPPSPIVSPSNDMSPTWSRNAYPSNGVSSPHEASSVNVTANSPTPTMTNIVKGISIFNSLVE